MKAVEDRDVDRDVGTGDPALVAGSLARSALTLARRFAAGATMWCVAPQWPAHGRHVAVEFVHPVIVGKRALPAVNIEGVDLIGTLRQLSRPGDVLLAVSSADEPRICDLMFRSAAWGLTRFWLGAGPTQPAADVEHVVWIDSSDPSLSARSGDMVLLYHLLWELTHVVFEHPGLLEPETGCSNDVCVTCSDQGVVAEVRTVDGQGVAQVIAAGRPETIDATLVEPLVPGDVVLVHAGVAIANLSERSGVSRTVAR
jgi:hydrogenase maturation factor